MTRRTWSTAPGKSTWSHRRSQTSDARSPCRKASRIMVASRWPYRLPRAASISASISVAPFGGRFRSRSGSLAGLPRRPARTKAAKRSARKLFDVVNAVLREFYDSVDDKVAKCGVHRATNCPSDLLESRSCSRPARGLRPRSSLAPRKGGMGGQARGWGGGSSPAAKTLWGVEAWSADRGKRFTRPDGVE